MPAWQGDALHVSLEYFCCQTRADAMKIESVYHTLDIPPVNVTFDRAVCRVDYDDGASLGCGVSACNYACSRA